MLLTIETESVRVELRGPHSVSGTWGSASGQLDVLTPPGDQIVDLVWTAPDGAIQHGAEGDGPALFEWTEYVLFAESKAGEALELRHRDPNLIQHVTSPSLHPELLTGPLSFRGQVGLTRLEFQVSGEPRLTVQLEVFPTKLDYASDYQDLLFEVNSTSRGLALEYLRATHRAGAAEGASQASNVEFATLLRHHIKDLQRSTMWIAQHPHRELLQQPELSRIEAMRRPSRLTRKAVRQLQGQGPLVSIPGVGSAHSRLPGMRSIETLDTPEHRWLRSALQMLRRRVGHLLDYTQMDIDRATNAGRSTARLKAEAGELAAAHGALARIVEAPPLSEATGRPPQGFSSLALLQMPGYREAVKSILAMTQGLSLDLGSIDVSVKDLEVLYEMWCFLRVASALCAISGGEPDFSSLFEGGQRGLRTRLKHGAKLEITVADRDTYRLIYNKSYAGYTGTQRPDLVLVVERSGWPDMHLILDAKYRLEAGKAHIKSYQIPGPPQDALNALHRYRDAIVLNYASADRKRPVVCGAALFPLDVATSADWSASPLGLSLETNGIGALPFLPSNEDFVNEWLLAKLSNSSSSLASSGGPDFPAAREVRTRKRLAETFVLLVTELEGPNVDMGAVDTLTVPAARLPPVSQVAVIVEDDESNSSLIAMQGQIRSIQAVGPEEMEIQALPLTHSIRSLIGTNGQAEYPCWTTALALSRARTASELGLGTVMEWELVELLDRNSIPFDIACQRSEDSQLRTEVEVIKDDSPAIISHREQEGFILASDKFVTVLANPGLVLDFLATV